MSTEKKEKMITITTSEGVKEIPENTRLDFEPMVFKPFGKTTRINSAALAKAIRIQFQKKFHDCCGCIIEAIPPQNNLAVTLFFQNNAKDIEPGKFKNLVNYTGDRPAKKDITQMMGYVNKQRSGKIYELNDETKLFLSDYMFGGRSGNPLKNTSKWDSLIFERRVPAGPVYAYGAENVIIGVRGLNLQLLCKALYGNEMIISTTLNADGKAEIESSESAYYECRPSKMLPDGTFMINIEQFDREMVDQYTRTENPQIAQSFGVQMY